jgi:DNA polymerase III psi subunit
LLVLEHRREADAPLLKALARVLPGCTICTLDTVPQGAARFAVQVGIVAPLPSDVLGVRVPNLAELRGSAAARRALWWAIKPLLKPLPS